MLLFIPQNIPKNKQIFMLMDIDKGKQASVQNAPYGMYKRVLEKLFVKLPPAFILAIMEFSDEKLEALSKNAKQKFVSGQGKTLDAYLGNLMLRELHQHFEALLPYAHLFQMYHRIWLTPKQVRTAPAQINQSRPILHFDVLKSQKLLIPHPVLTIQGEAHQIENVLIFNYWVLLNNTYYLLRYTDYLTLSWVQSNEWSQFSSDTALFKENVISRLEKTNKVNRNGHFKETIIQSAPIERIMLNEISGTFLMLTPQWKYEGFLVDGTWQQKQEFTQAGEVYIVQRDKEKESGLVAYIRGQHPNFTAQHNGYFFLSFADAQKKNWFLKVYHEMVDKGIELVGMDMLNNFRYSQYPATTTATITQRTAQSLILSFSLHFGKEEIGLFQLQKILLSGQRAIFLKDGSMGILTDEWLGRYANILKHGKITKGQIEIARWMAINESDLWEKSGDVQLKTTIDDTWWLKWQQWQSGLENVYPLPADIKASLRPYQHNGFEWMALLAELGAGCCLADDMGLGKTLQSICLLAHQHNLSPTDLNLIVCPASLIYNWVHEVQKFSPKLTTMVYHGQNRNMGDIVTKNPKVLITTYQTLRSDIATLGAITYGVVVVDESHNIKNPASQITKALSQVQSKARIALSGTPVMNNTFDLYAQLSFLLPGMFGGADFFKKEYADPIDRQQDDNKVKALQKMTSPFILRRTKEQVAADLPEKTESILWCDMGPEQRELYDTIKERVRNSVFLEIEEKGVTAGKLGILNAMNKLRQVCNHSALIKNNNISQKASVKTEVLMTELQLLIENHKVLVFSQFTSMLDILGNSLANESIPFLRIDGSTPVSKRQQLVDSFQSKESENRVFLISLKAGNTGLNLTSADYVFLFDPWWNTAVQQQAIDRAHRIGQTKKVFAYQMICKGTIEERIIQLQERKKKLASELIGADDSFIKTLSQDDVSFLFS